LMLGLYWLGLQTWFYQDDFGWLRVRLEIHGWRDVLPALFFPKAHGNLRPLSETGFFTLFSAVFGVEPLPFRIWVFLTQAAGLWLLGDLVRRWTHSRWAGLAAQGVWLANRGLAPVMCWTSVYNQVLCGFLLLLALWCLVRHLETGERRWWRAQWVAFVLGLGALETAVVYPALAAIYAPKLWRRIAPMFAVSAGYAALHFAVAPGGGGVYALHLDGALPATLWRYWSMALDERWWVVAVLTAAALASRAWFGLAWFLITLAPYLPLRDHVMDYYLAVPAIGLAMAAGRAAARTPRMAAAVLALYFAVSVPAVERVVRWHYARSQAMADVVLGVAEARRLDPGRTILLANLPGDVFLSGFADLPFQVLGIERVYLAPGEERRVQAPRELVGKFVLPEAVALREQAVVYDASGPVLRNVTSRYAPYWRPVPPAFVNAGDPLFAPYLSGDWAPAHKGTRVLRGTARIDMAAPAAGERLWIGLFAQSPRLSVRLNGVERQPEMVKQSLELAEWAYSLPVSNELSITLSSPEPLTFGFAENR